MKNNCFTQLEDRIVSRVLSEIAQILPISVRGSYMNYQYHFDLEATFEALTEKLASRAKELVDEEATVTV